MKQYINGLLYDLSAPPAWSVDWEVEIGGKNRTGMLRPYLIDISVTDKAGTTSDSCSLTLDDTGGQVALDMEGLDITVVLKGHEVFQGTIETARSTGSRGGGRLIPITAKGFDTRGKAKQISHSTRMMPRLVILCRRLQSGRFLDPPRSVACQYQGSVLVCSARELSGYR